MASACSSGAATVDAELIPAHEDGAYIYIYIYIYTVLVHWNHRILLMCVLASFYLGFLQLVLQTDRGCRIVSCLPPKSSIICWVH